jgi:hypothetical protein
MTDNRGDFQQGATPEDTYPKDPPSPSSEPTQPSVSVELPIDIVNAIHQHICQSGQTPTQAILDVLRSAVSQSTVHHSPSEQPLPEQEPSEPQIPGAGTLPGSSPLPPIDPITEIYRLSARLAQLEALIPKLADLQGKSIAF